MTFDVNSQRLILVVVLARSLYQVDVDHAVAFWTFDVESKPQVFSAPLILLRTAANISVACPPRPRGLAMGRNLGAWAKQLLAAVIGTDARGCAVEVGRLGRG